MTTSDRKREPFVPYIALVPPAVKQAVAKAASDRRVSMGEIGRRALVLWLEREGVNLPAADREGRPVVERITTGETTEG